MYMVLCETGFGRRYHVFTDIPENYNEDLVWKLNVEDVDSAVESGYVRPESWDEDGDAEAAFGEAADVYHEQIARMESDRIQEEEAEWDRANAAYSD